MPNWRPPRKPAKTADRRGATVQKTVIDHAENTMSRRESLAAVMPRMARLLIVPFALSSFEAAQTGEPIAAAMQGEQAASL